MPFTLTDINEKLGHVAILRDEVERTKQGIRARQEYLFDSDPYYKNLVQNLAEASAALDEKEAELRAWGMAIFQDSGSKKPHPAIGIRVMTDMVYNVNDALEYVMKHNHPELITIKQKQFETLASVLHLDFVTFLPKIVVTLSGDLSEYIPPAPPATEELE